MVANGPEPSRQPVRKIDLDYWWYGDFPNGFPTYCRANRHENVRILAFMFGLLRDVQVWSTVGVDSEGLSPCISYVTVSGTCQDGILAVQMGIAAWFIRGPNGWWYRKYA